MRRFAPVLMLLLLVFAGCGGQSHLVADESVIAVSPCADSIFLYTLKSRPVVTK